MKLIVCCLMLSLGLFAADPPAPEKPKTDLTDQQVWQLRYFQERRRASLQAIALARQAIKEAEAEAGKAEAESNALVTQVCKAAQIKMEECRIDLQQKRAVAAPKEGESK